MHGLLAGASTRLADAIWSFIASINRRTRLFLWAAGTAAAFFGVLILTIAESPNLGGMVRGFFAGLFVALLFAAAGAWLLMWTNSPRSRTHLDIAKAAAGLDTLLAPTLRELNAVRAGVIRDVKARSATRVPLGIAGSVALWMLAQWSDDPPGYFELLIFVVCGAIAGELWAVGKLDREYGRQYKDRVLPRLAARFGDLTYRQASLDAVHRLQAQRILQEFDIVNADDEIVGTYRGLPLDLVEARLSRQSGQNASVVFDGLLIELTLPRRLTGTTVVLTDEGMFGNLKAGWTSGAMQRVRLEDPRFEQRYEVYSDDQVEARALLTPAFMERFMALAALSGFSLPGAMAEGNRLVVALPKGVGARDLFEPPVYWKPAGGQALLQLEEDIRAVLSMADTVIELDFWATGRHRDSMTT